LFKLAKSEKYLFIYCWGIRSIIMRERIFQAKKAASPVSISTLKQPTRGFGLESWNASPPAMTRVQPLNKPLSHDISKISLRPQAKLSISQPGDTYEQEADSVARQVMQRMALSGNRQSIQRQEVPEEEEELQMKPLEISTLQRQEAPEEEEELQMKPLDITTLQRQEAPEEEEELQMKPLEISTLQRQQVPEEEELQMKPLEISTLQRQEAPEEEEELQMKSMVQRQANGGMTATADLETFINQARGGGQPLGDNIREPMEQAFGADFGGVKVHTDSHSDGLNRSIQARAFTTGQDIFFRQGEYNPGSRGGQELLAHELTHVVQQNENHLSKSSLPHTFNISSISQSTIQGVFSNPTSLQSHFNKHVNINKDAGGNYADSQAYEAAADAIVADPSSSQKNRAAGGMYYLNKTTGQFVATNSSGRVLTMFVPTNPQKYYDNQS
jgi:hypothetical protein